MAQEKNNKGKENNKNKHFFKDFKAELKRVIWPTGKQVVNNTVAVLTIVVITAVVVLILDLGFEIINTYGVNKLKQLVNSNTTQQNEITDENNQNETSEPTSTTENNIDTTETSEVIQNPEEQPEATNNTITQNPEVNE